MHALVFRQFGAPDVLQWEEIPDPIPSENQALVRTKAIGLNFADIYRRKGNYHLAGNPPWICGYEAAGIIESAPSNSIFKKGDQVAFADAPFANAELVCVDVEKLIPLPADIPFKTAAAVLLQGLTAQYLIRDSYAVKANDRVVVHAAAGGVGQLLVQLAKSEGAIVHALVSNQEKAQAALAAGANFAHLYSQEWPSELQKHGGANAVFDSVGSTLMQSFDACRNGGHVVFYGMAGGNPIAVDPRFLMDRSLTLTGGDLWNVLTSAEIRRSRANELFQRVREGKLHVAIDREFALRDGANAHAWLESRRAKGKVLLLT
jgi:NADPH:quinone reductase